MVFNIRRQNVCVLKKKIYFAPLVGVDGTRQRHAHRRLTVSWRGVCNDERHLTPRRRRRLESTQITVLKNKKK